MQVVAASPLAYQRLVLAISERSVRRRYLAVCEGVMMAGQDIDRPVGRDPRLRPDTVREDGKPAQTQVRVRDRYRTHTAVDLVLGSGRTHQIRVHMRYRPCLSGRYHLWMSSNCTGGGEHRNRSFLAALFAPGTACH